MTAGGEMTHEFDFIRVHFESGVKDLNCKKNNIPWPPPELLDIGGFKFKRNNMSSITDEQIFDMSHVCRGAEYFAQTNLPMSTGGDEK